jgi:hypothetical protein
MDPARDYVRFDWKKFLKLLDLINYFSRLPDFPEGLK